MVCWCLVVDAVWWVRWCVLLSTRLRLRICTMVCRKSVWLSFVFSFVCWVCVWIAFRWCSMVLGLGFLVV